MRISTSTKIVAAVLFAGVLGLVAVNHFATQQLKVRGPDYLRIVADKDIVADIAPPALYVIEAYLEVTKLMLEPDKLDNVAKRLGQLRSDFDKRRQFWVENPHIGEKVRSTLLGAPIQTGNQFWDLVDKELLPALRKKDVLAARKTLAQVASAFEAHRQAVDVTMDVTTTAMVAVEAKSKELETWWSMVTLIVAGMMMLLLTLAAFGMGKFVLGPMNAISDTMKKLTGGDRDVTVFGLGRTDEIGEMAASVEGFRQDAIEREKLQVAQRDAAGQIAAINKTQAVVELTLDGKVLTANANFLDVMGYSLDDIKGQHHSKFVEPAISQSQEYRLFWEKLGRGESDSGQYKRIGRGGKEVWIQASYNGVSDETGKPFKIVKIASDITAQVKASQMLQVAVKDTQSVVIAAQNHDLSQRVPLDGKTGDIAQLCQGLNGLLDTIGEIVSEVGKVAEAAREHDLTRRISMDGKQGDIARLCEGVNGVLDTMSQVVRDVTIAATEVTNAASEIATGTADLSQRTEQQAASLEETAASMEEIASTVKQNADNAAQANQLAISSRTVATEGGAIVGKAVEAMSRIEASSQKISDIIGVIDEIAFQTNLLALNAAVEAARAGDAGKGFAVVAQEVRSLAQRSSGAAKDIKSLINQSSSQVKDGVKLVNDTGASLNQIVDSIKKVTDIVSEIAAASREQSTGVEEVNKAVAQMDEMTQKNSALVEESATASRTLQDQALALRERMAVFATAPGGATAASHPALLSLRPGDASTVADLTRQSEALAQKPSKSARVPVRRGANGGAAALQAQLEANFEADGAWKEF